MGENNRIAVAINSPNRQVWIKATNIQIEFGIDIVIILDLKSSKSEAQSALIQNSNYISMYSVQYMCTFKVTVLLSLTSAKVPSCRISCTCIATDFSTVIPAFKFTVYSYRAL